MMNNETQNNSMKISGLTHYLLGESIKNIFIRLTVILAAIILVWSGIMLALIIHTKYQRMKQMQKLSNSHHHHFLYDSTSSLNKARPAQRNRRFDTSTSSLTSGPCHCFRQVFTQLKEHCFFWPSSREAYNEDIINQSRPDLRSKLRQEPIASTSSLPSSNKIQFVVEAMTRRPVTSNHQRMTQGRRTLIHREMDSSSGDEARHVELLEKSEPWMKNSSSHAQLTTNRVETVQIVEPKANAALSSVAIPIDATMQVHQPNERRLFELHQLNNRATLLFHPITRRLSNIRGNAILPPVNAIQNQKRNRPAYMVSSARELSSHNEWKWQHSWMQDSDTVADRSLTSSARHIPLVMITDTSSSNTNIIELETYEDKHRLIGDTERRLSRELRASYRPRHST